MNESIKNTKILITGAGGFIGGHLIKYLRKKGYQNIRAVDIKPFTAWYQVDPNAENMILDLNNPKH